MNKLMDGLNSPLSGWLLLSHPPSLTKQENTVTISALMSSHIWFKVRTCHWIEKERWNEASICHQLCLQETFDLAKFFKTLHAHINWSVLFTLPQIAENLNLRALLHPLLLESNTCFLGRPGQVLTSTLVWFLSLEQNCPQEILTSVLGSCYLLKVLASQVNWIFFIISTSEKGSRCI